MKTKFRELKLSKKNIAKLELINSIIQQYRDEGYRMTLRQLYYQLVSRDVIPNEKTEYAKISKLLKEGRMAGIVDWEAIEDRLRVPYLPYWNIDPKEAIEDTVKQYRLNRQRGQETYVEVWVEKDALSGVLKKVTSKYHVKLLVNRGYGSVTAIHDAYKRYSVEIEHGRNIVLLYLGDHDPSGMDMIRDINSRIGEMLEVQGMYGSLEVRPIALTMGQIRKYNPPENPAKLTDPRAKWYIEKFGYKSWELDALEPKVLNNLVSSEIEKSINMDIFRGRLQQEEEDKKKLRELTKNFR